MTQETLEIVARHDVRGRPCSERKAAIFGQFAELEPGEAFEFINDHDPAGLKNIFNEIAPGAYGWTYVEAGPEEWRIRIERV